MDIAGAFSAVASATQIVKEIREIDAGLAQAELKLKIADLSTLLADTKLALVDVQEQLVSKDREIAQLKASMEFGKSLEEYHGYKYEVDADGNKVGNPYCPRCERVDGRFIRTESTREAGLPKMCPQCKAAYHGVPTFQYQG